MARKKDPSIISLQESKSMLGDKLNFAAAEAYKLLRTNLSFSLADDEGRCKIIGFTSALRGEGKTTTAINMAYTIAQTGKRVLLLEADLRLPTIARRLQLKSKPGISNMLVGQCQGGDILQPCPLIDNMMVITAGEIPPNPAELLGSEQMETMLKALSRSFDAIIVDLPPVNAVSDALIMSKLVNGMVIVVRQDYCDKGELAEVVRQLQFAATKILGFVMTGADTQEKSYKHGRYKKYGYNYGYYKKRSASKAKMGQ